MGDGNSASQSKRRQELKNKYITRLMPVISHQGLSHLKIDDLVRFMCISKATFYKYFSSKEEVTEQVADLVVSYFKEAATLIGDGSSSYLLRFQDAFSHNPCLLQATGLMLFLLDLKQTAPALWERIQQAQQERQQQLQQFYEQGIAQGIFNPIRPVLVMLQNELLLTQHHGPRLPHGTRPDAESVAL